MSGLIRCLGQFWTTDSVFWGRRKNPGTLLGISAKSKKSGEVNFWDQRGFYALYAQFRLVYVGQTGARGLGVRLREHRRDFLAGRWDSFSWYGLRWVKANGDLSIVRKAKNLDSKTILDHVEGILINAAEPPLNSQDGRFGDDVEMFLQKRDERLPPANIPEVLARIEARLAEFEET